ncbi:hypothetical protein G3M48_007761 [Beauveria asiatica]|uniref:Arginase family protein n=1 Tax=Beauveria asiatica TaxID=1069075 RepID=A0AAW0S6F3_9HYPO
MRLHLATWASLAHGAIALSAYDYNNPGAAQQVRFWLNDESADLNDVVVTQMPFLTGTGFATLPVTDCFSDDKSDELRYDIAILGAPHDTRDAMHDWATIVDCGDAKMTWLDNRVALRTLETAHRKISGRRAKSSDGTSAPRIITLGGDHTTTLAALRVTEKHWGPVSVIHFDSHVDTWDPKQLGGGISEYAALNHGTFLHFAHEENLILNSSIHAGIRAQVTDASDMRHDKTCGFHIITARDIDFIGVGGIIDRIRQRVQNTRVYLSVDIDVLDPAFAPEVIGGDVVEVAPPYDNNAATTALAAAEIAFAILELMVSTPVKV